MPPLQQARSLQPGPCCPGMATTEKSPGKQHGCLSPSLRSTAGDVRWWLPAQMPSGDNGLLRAEELTREQAVLRKGVLQAESLSPGLSVQAALPQVTACHGRHALQTAKAASFFPGSRTRRVGDLQALRRGTGGQARWRTAGVQPPRRRTGTLRHRRAPAGYGHSAGCSHAVGIRPGCRCCARVQQLYWSTGTPGTLPADLCTAGHRDRVQSHCHVEVHGGGMSSGYRC